MLIQSHNPVQMVRVCQDCHVTQYVWFFYIVRQSHSPDPLQVRRGYDKSNTTGTTCGAGAAYPSGTPEFTLCF